MNYNSLSELCLKLGRSSPDAKISDEHLAKIATDLKEWEPLAHHLGINKAKEMEIRHDTKPSSYWNQKHSALREWRSGYGMLATYAELSRIFLKSSVIASYQTDLKGHYKNAKSSAIPQWPRPKKPLFINPVMFEIPVSDARPEKMPAAIHLDRLDAVLSSDQGGEVVLIEGVAGVGKTMFTWHAGRLWAEGLLFRGTQLLIHISLRDSHIHSAETLTDLIPHHNKPEEVADAIAEQSGRRVCFMLDGWDELPLDLRDDSFLLDFISQQTPHASLPECKIVITSRPLASASLTPYVKKKFEIQGFKEEQLKKYISDSTQGRKAITDKLIQTVSSNPELMQLCMLPLMAAVLVFLSAFPGEILTLKTRTDMFKRLVLVLLLRHMQLRLCHPQKLLREFTDLPEDMKEKFRTVCNVAFHGVVDDKVVFDLDDLESLGISSEIDTLGLMQTNEQLTWFGAIEGYSFLHRHIQDFLAGYHISRLPDDEHGEAVRKVLAKDSCHLNFTLTVYAKLTTLKNQTVVEVLKKKPEVYRSLKEQI